jgi:hypothetical protein
MTFLINGRDEPRVVFDYREPGARSKALAVTEEIPFDISPHPTSNFFRDRSGCNILRRPEGFTTTANDDSACEWSYNSPRFSDLHDLVFISSAKTGFTVDLYPTLSMAKVSPCFADILFPIEARPTLRIPRLILLFFFHSTTMTDLGGRANSRIPTTSNGRIRNLKYVSRFN